MTGSETGL